MLKQLIGSQLVDLNDEQIFIKKDDNIYCIELDTDQGDCCGYAEISASLLIDRDDIKNNPVITNVEIDTDESDCSVKGKLTLFGESKPLVEVNGVAGSGSGYCYGAIARVYCKALNISESVVSW